MEVASCKEVIELTGVRGQGEDTRMRRTLELITDCADPRADCLFVLHI